MAVTGPIVQANGNITFFQGQTGNATSPIYNWNNRRGIGQFVITGVFNGASVALQYSFDGSNWNTAATITVNGPSTLVYISAGELVRAVVSSVGASTNLNIYLTEVSGV